MQFRLPLFGLMLVFAAGAARVASPAEPSPWPIRDKTLVAWVALADLNQRGGSVLTVEDDDSRFDAMVFGEIAPRKWMPGSEYWQRTTRDQGVWPEEEAAPGQFIQVAVVYRDREVTLFRSGHEIAHYTTTQPALAFDRAPTVLFGRRHLEVRDRDNSFAGRIRDARIYDRALESREIAALKTGTTEGGPSPWAWWAFGDEGLREKTGRYTQIQLDGDVRLAEGALVLGGHGATVIFSPKPADGEPSVEAPRAWSPGGPVPDSVVRSTRILRERLVADPYRPTYHFCLPEGIGIPGDPNGAFYHQGRYHLMYLYDRSGVGMSWGHVSSGDLVHWRHHPDAIGPGQGDEGCFSGGAFVDTDGTAYLSYWMLWGAKGIGLARSTDRLNERWTKLEANPVIRSTDWGITEFKDPSGRTNYYGSADPSNIWKKDGRYYLLTGNLLVLDKLGRSPNAPLSEQGDRLYLFVSDDLKRWEYVDVFYQRRAEWTEASEDNMCPSFLPLPSGPDGGPPSPKHLLLFISHNKGCQYYIGDYRGDRFHPERHGRMTWVDNTYFAPEALIDGQGRQIMWVWLLDNPSGEKRRGWSGVYGLPRSLWLGEDGNLRLRPVKELESLRRQPRSWFDLGVAADASHPLPGVVGDACEINLEVDPGRAEAVGLKVRASPDGAEETLLYYDSRGQALVFDATRSGLDGRRVVERAPFALSPGESLKLRVFVDRSVIEIFANDRQAIGRRVYPARADSLGISVFARGAATRFRSIQAWEMIAANPF